MTEAEIKEIILTEVIGRWPSHFDLDRANRAAKRIADAVQRKLNGQALPAYYPSRACDCGAARVGPDAKHGPMCSLNGGARR